MNKADREYLDRLVSLGCIACWRKGIFGTPAEVHHIRTGIGKSQRASHRMTLPLCPPHHRTGGYGVAFHAGRKAWEAEFGTELELLEIVQQRLAALETEKL